MATMLAEPGMVGVLVVVEEPGVVALNFRLKSGIQFLGVL